ncbi:cyclic nucleotide-binding domain-containing protein [Aliiglaciecola sp.]|nr:cyclic nucleotide-binding domain-containing protein [Aliiglaciecola sp.]
MLEQQYAYSALRRSLESYSAISNDTWQAFATITKMRRLKKQTLLYKAGDVPQSYSYVYQGLIRCFVCDEKGNEYNKMFFDEDKFPGSMSALLTASPSVLTFETIEDSIIIEIDFVAYRQLMLEKEDLKLFQIHYLEKNWLLAKDAREIEIVQEDATARYLRFVALHSNLVDRLPQYHIASHLGITPTQLSRIRKKL